MSLVSSTVPAVSGTAPSLIPLSRIPILFRMKHSDTIAAIAAQYLVIQNCCGGNNAEAFRLAADSWLQLSQELGLTDEGRAGPLNNGNIVRYVSHPQHGDGILKVSITPAYNEGVLLQHYSTLHLPIPHLHAHGTLPQDTHADFPWVWTALLHGEEPPHPLTPAAITAGAHLAAHLRQPLSTAPAELHLPLPHSHDNTLQQLQDREDALHVLLHRTFSASSHLAAVHAAWDRMMQILHSHTTEDDWLLHADLRSRNTLLGINGTLYAIDPYGGVGPAETDMAVWISIAAAQQATNPQESILTVLQADPYLNADMLEALVIAHILLLAEGEKRHPGFLHQQPEDVLTALYRSFLI